MLPLVASVQNIAQGRPSLSSKIGDIRMAGPLYSIEFCIRLLELITLVTLDGATGHQRFYLLVVEIVLSKLLYKQS